MLKGTLSNFSLALGESTLRLPKQIIQSAQVLIDTLDDFPTTRHEDWKYTRLKRVANLVLSSFEYQTDAIANEAGENEIHFLDNQWYLSKINTGIHVQSAHQLTQEDWKACINEGHVQALNVITAKGGVSIEIQPNTHLSKPIRLKHTLNENGKAMVLHHQIVVGKNSTASLSLISHGNACESYQNILIDIFLEEGAQFHVDKLQQTEGNSYSFYSERVFQNRSSQFSLQTVSLDNHFIRNDVEVYSNGEGTHSQLYGAFMGKEKNHQDHHTYMHHKFPNCTSDENYKGILRDQATGVFNGKVKVYIDAQKINAFQSNKNLLLSEFASMNSKPELEIYADDVKCSHGSTTGQLDEQALFFLQARGIGKEKATKLLTSAFIQEVSDKVQCPYINEVLNKHLA